MSRLLPFLAWTLGVAGLGALVAWSADRAWWSAALLHAEPLVLAALAVGAYVGFARRRPAVAAGLGLGGLAFFAALRLPAAEAPRGEGPGDWAARVSRCAGALDPPQRPIAVLQWTLPPDGAEEATLHAALALQPEVVVLFRLADPGVLHRLRELRGGEWHYHPPSGQGEGVGVWVSGAFPYCGEEEEWTAGLDRPGGYAMSFVDVEGTIFPLVVATFPGIDTVIGWGSEMGAATGRVGAMLDALGTPHVVLAADAPVTRTYRFLEARLRGRGLASVGEPPNWPVRLGRLPFLPLHAYDRLWTGAGWRVADTRTLSASTGTRHPLVTTLAPARAVGALQKPPPSPTPPGATYSSTR